MEGGKLEEVDTDRDVFKDNSVVMLNLPGHTPGHHGLLVKLAGKGYVLLSADREPQRNCGQVAIPGSSVSINTSRRRIANDRSVARRRSRRSALHAEFAEPS